MSQPIAIGSLPHPLAWHNPPPEWRLTRDGLTVTTAARTDLFADPTGTAPTLTAHRLTGPEPGGDYTLRARVAVEFQTTYDAAVLLLYGDERHWAKLCLE